MNCRTCKHFSPNYSKELYIGEKKVFTKDLSERMGFCEAIEFEDYKVTEEVIVANGLAYTQDGESYGALVVVSPDFGCVLYEPKENK